MTLWDDIQRYHGESGMDEDVELLRLDSVVVDERVRKDMGDIDELCNSIKAVGLIQPIVISRDNRLIAGERRLRALKRLGVDALSHAKTFIYNDEVDPLRISAMEIEENVKRKQLTWQEEVLAKKRLLDIMVQLHGVSHPGHPSRSENLGITSAGFGVNKLSALLGESNAQTSKDLELAELIITIPQLAKAETKEAARRTALLATTVAIALKQSAANPPKQDQKWTLYEGDFVANIDKLGKETIDLVVCDPPYGAETSGMGPNSKDLLADRFVDTSWEVVKMLTALAQASYYCLRPNTFACFFFDFICYKELLQAMRYDHLEPDIAPLIWVKNTVINTSPYTRYSRSYEPILLARKGEPKLIRPTQRDVIQIDNVITRGVNEQKLYQAQKPVALIEKLILDLCVPGGTVVDFCAGSGTTGEAALKNGRRAVLFEKDATACQIIRGRLGKL